MNWIPVTERLPESRQHVICSYKDKHGNFLVLFGFYADDGWYKTPITTIEHTLFVGNKITHWMPLPKAPEHGETQTKIEQNPWPKDRLADYEKLQRLLGLIVGLEYNSLSAERVKELISLAEHLTRDGMDKGCLSFSLWLAHLSNGTIK